MEKKVLNYLPSEAINKAKKEIKDLQRSENPNFDKALYAIEDLLDSVKVEEIANESNDEICARISNEMKSSNAESIAKAVEDAFAKRANAQAIVDTKNDATYAKNFTNAVLTNIERGESINLENALKRVDNAISTFVFPTEVETAIRRTWEDHSEILSWFKQTQRASIPYTVQDQQANDVLARIQSAPDVEKTEQNLTISYVTLTYDYFYKLNYINKKDIMLARQFGTESALVAEIFAELTEQVITGVVVAALLTGASKGGSTFITSIARTTGDSWVNVYTASGANPTITEVRIASDAIIKGEVVLICNKANKTALETLESGQTTGLVYMDENTMLAQCGVQKVITTELVGNCIILLARDAYALGNFGMESQRFEKITFNKDGLIAEMLCGGNMVELKGASVILPPSIVIKITSGTIAVTTGTIADDTYNFTIGNISESIAISSGAGTATTIPDGTYRVITRGKTLTLVK